jgi:hypothetical protein
VKISSVVIGSSNAERVQKAGEKIGRKGTRAWRRFEKTRVSAPVVKVAQVPKPGVKTCVSAKTQFERA